MDPNLLRRREKFLKLKCRGVSIQAAAEEMTKDITDPYEREKQIRTIRKDWANRAIWLHLIVKYENQTLLTEILEDINEACSRAWVEYFKQENPGNTKVGALRTIIGGKTRSALLLMKNGVIAMAPQQVESYYDVSGYSV